MKASLTPDYFDRLYAQHADPWRFATSEYEAAKYADTLAALDRPRYARGFEVGCSIGIFTRQLAERCDALLAVDVAEQALAEARRRLRGMAQVTIAKMQVPEAFPAGKFDLILWSEVLYYFDPATVDHAADCTRAALAPGGTVLLVHYTEPTDYPLSGDSAAERFVRSSGLRVSLRRRAASYRLDRLAAPG